MCDAQNEGESGCLAPISGSGADVHGAGMKAAMLGMNVRMIDDSCVT